jgi:hypothetical protein
MSRICADCEWGRNVRIYVDGKPLCHEHYLEWLAVEAAAQAGEAGTAETVKQGSVHEHAVGEADAPKG